MIDRLRWLCIPLNSYSYNNIQLESYKRNSTVIHQPPLFCNKTYSCRVVLYYYIIHLYSYKNYCTVHIRACRTCLVKTVCNCASRRMIVNVKLIFLLVSFCQFAKLIEISFTFSINIFTSTFTAPLPCMNNLNRQNQFNGLNATPCFTKHDTSMLSTLHCLSTKRAFIVKLGSGYFGGTGITGIKFL